MSNNVDIYLKSINNVSCLNSFVGDSRKERLNTVRIAERGRTFYSCKSLLSVKATELEIGKFKLGLQFERSEMLRTKFSKTFTQEASETRIPTQPTSKKRINLLKDIPHEEDFVKLPSLSKLIRQTIQIADFVEAA